MTTGYVIVDHLNVRPFAPERNGRRSEVILQRGSRVKVIGAVYGQELEGVNIWYVQPDNSFIWSGGVRTEEEIIPPVKRVIFTADDYGVIDTIDAGVLKAINKGLLRSVACLTNCGREGAESLRRIRILEALNKPDLEIGAHLTITSGSPVIGRTNAEKLCRPVKKKPSGFPQSDFHKYTKIRSAYVRKNGREKELFREQLAMELEAQINVLKAPKSGGAIRVDHLSVHHNAHLYHSHFFQIFMDTAKKHNLNIVGNDLAKLPFRSLHNVPEWKDNLFLNFKGKVGSFTHAKALKRLFCSEYDQLDSPGFLNSGHYGPLPIQNMYGYYQSRLVRMKRKKFGKMLNDLRWGDFKSMEFLLHVRDGEVFTRQRDYFDRETKPVGYAGIDFRAFDTRTAELSSFLQSLPSEQNLPVGVSLGRWRQLEPREMCI